MKECNSLPLQAISPKNNFKDFYLKYQKRKKPFLLIHEKHLPQIKINTDNNFDSNESKNNNKNILDLPILSPLKTNINTITYFPKISAMRPRLTNMKIQLGQKLQKSKRKLNIKYIDIINMNKDKKLLIDEINKVSQFEEEISRHIYDPLTKNKIKKEINIIDKNTNDEIKEIVNNITNEEKEEALKYFNVNPKIINLCAEEILKDINNQNNVYATIRSYNKEKEIKKRNKKIKGNNSFFREKLGLDFLMCAKNNIRKKIELRNQYNKEISIEYIEILLKNEIEKIKLIISLYLKNEQDENILFDIDGNNSSGENSKEKLIKAKKNKAIDKYIKKLMNFKNIYDDMIRTNYDGDDENYKNNTSMKNEITQYNYKDFSKYYPKDKNMRYNKENEYINNNLNKSDNNEKNKSVTKSNEENKLNLENSNIFLQFEKFSQKRNNEKNNIDLQKTSNINEKDSIKNEKINETLQRKTIHTIKSNKEINKDSLINNNKINNSNSYKTSIENQKIVSKSNKDILSLLASTKYKSNDNIKKTNRQKVNEKLDLINKDKKEKEVKPIPNISNGHSSNNGEIIQEYSKKLEKILKYENEEDIKKEENNEEDSNKDNYSNISKNYEENLENVENVENEENEENEEYEEYEDDENSNNNEENEEQNGNSNEEKIKSKYIYNRNDNNLENDNKFFSMNNDEQNINNNPLNILNNQQPQKQKEKHKLTKIQKKPKIKKNKIQKNKMSPDKIKKSDSTKLEHSKSKSSNKKNNNNTNRNQRQIITKDLIVSNKSPNRNKIKNIKNDNLFKKAIIKLNQVKNVIPQKKQRKSLLDFEKTKRFKIKDFEYIEKEKPKRKLSFQNIIKVEKPKNQNEGDLNVIKLYDDDMERIVDFINDEEKRRVKKEKNAQRMAKEKIEDSNKNILYSLFKVKKKKKEEEKQDQEDLTKEDIVEKLKRDDWRTRQYIEDIIRSGLTLGNKELNKQMKNKTLLIFQGLELGTFKFKRNFGIKEEDINITTTRPKSNKDLIHKESKKIEKEKEKKRMSKIIKEKKAKDKQKELEEKEKEKQRKKEEAKKKLIYDNSYLFAKKKKSINFILRKEIEEIVQGGILLQQLANKEEEKIAEVKSRFLPPKRPKFIKKKKNRGKLFRKSKFLKDVVDNDIIIPKKENDYSSSESVIKEESNNSFEDKMQTLIDRVKKLKKGEELNINEVENIMNQKNIIRNKKEKQKENRIQGFMNTLNEYRDMNKNSRKRNNFFYKVPILIMANSEGD